MHLDPQLLRALAFGVLIAFLLSSRATKGKAKQTAEGLAFGIKPFFQITRAFVLLAYVALVSYLSLSHQSKIPPVWVFVVMAALLAVSALRLPGTIMLTPTAVVQHFWFFKDKQIPYNEVMAVGVLQAGRATRVMGANRVNILHSPNHSAAEDFRHELELRTGKKAVM